MGCLPQGRSTTGVHVQQEAFVERKCPSQSYWQHCSFPSLLRSGFISRFWWKSKSQTIASPALFDIKGREDM